MARIPDQEIEQLKREVALERLAAARGVKLARHGKDLIGLCPFHDDHEPSLVISPEKNLWHCLGACQRGGTVIDWVMVAERVSFRHAVELLRQDQPARDTAPPLPRSAEPVVATAADHAELLGRVVTYYHETLLKSAEALGYLEQRGLRNDAAIARFRLGFANRTLGYRLPSKGTSEGKRVREHLQQVGILRESGHEHFNGSLVVPIFDRSGQVVEMYGRKVTAQLRAGTPLHLYLPGPHRGIWNVEALADSHEIILCESLLDALTFWVHGYRSVTTSYGVEGFTAEHLEAFDAYRTRRVLIAYDRDAAGDRAAAALAVKLGRRGIECYRVMFPRGMDANDYAQMVAPAEKSLGLALRKAEWLGHGKAPDHKQPEPSEAAKGGAASLPPLETLEPLDTAATTPSRPPLEDLPLDAASEASPPVEVTATPSLEASPMPAPQESEPPIAEVRSEEVVMVIGDRRYRVRGLSKNLSFDVLRINLHVARGEGFHVDTLDLYNARQRGAFQRLAASELGVTEERLKKDLGQVLVRLEELQEKAIHEALAPKEKPVTLSEDERTEALALLRSPRLLEEVLEDFAHCGIVGEETNKLLGYLAVVSRKLSEPLAIVVQSSSAAGKSSLMDGVLALVPEEDRVQYSAMTGQSLFYLGERDLRHKVLAIVEEEGAERASYALKLLQSEGELSIASTGKDPQTGRLTTYEYEVEGPVMIFLTTTSIDLDEELENRCLRLTVDEGREQTRAIHRLQRQRRTLDGIRAQDERERAIRREQNAQRLLEPLVVVNPYAERLTFLDVQIRSRRDHEKYLTLIDSLALLHQHQREVKTMERGGEVLRYIEVLPEDIAVANRLAAEALGRSLDELPPQTRRFLELLEGRVAERCAELEIERSEYRFARREVREWLGCSVTQARVHLERLLELEYVLAHRGRRGQSFEYELVYESGATAHDRFHAGLLQAETLGYDDNLTGLRDNLTGQSSNLTGPKRGQNGAMTGGWRGSQSGSISLAGNDLAPRIAVSTKNALIPPTKVSPSYRSRSS